MKKSVFTQNAPAPVGPFSQAIVTQGVFLYVSGNAGLSANGLMVEGGIKEQTRQVLANMKAVLIEAGYSISDVVKVNVFLTDMKDFTAMNEVYAEFFTKPEPARTTIQAAALPVNAIVEMDLIAVK